MRIRRLTLSLLFLISVLPGLLLGCGDSEKNGKDFPKITTNNGKSDSNNETNNGVVLAAGVDLVVDTNRDGLVDLESESDQTNEETWSVASGAFFLANIDDDDLSCSKDLDDLALSECFDGADEQLDGAEDLKDLAPLYIRLFGDVPDVATTATLSITRGGDRIRLFNLSDQTLFSTPATLSRAQLTEGVQLGVEGKDINRDNSWDGLVEIEINLDWPEAPAEAVLKDTVVLKIAPLLLRHHLEPADTVYSSELGMGGDESFTNDLKFAALASGVPGGHVEIEVEDQWAQDYFETGYMAMPSSTGLHVIEVFIRSANIEQDRRGQLYLRPAGRFALEASGVDRAGISAVTTDGHSLDWDTLNSFGNTETIPPYEHAGKAYPAGRILRGSGYGDQGDVAMRLLFEAQHIQDPLWIPTGWLFVGHVDETVSFVAAPGTERGWVLLANDARMATRMLEDLQAQGAGATPMFQGKNWYNYDNGGEYSAVTDIDATLGDPDVMSANATAVVEIDEQVNQLKAATGLTDAEVISIPFLHQDYNGYSVALQPGTVNGLVPKPGHFWAPDPHGPRADGGDIMKTAMEEQLAPFGVQVSWVEDWDMFHRLAGEVHCGSNTLRAKPTRGWWESNQ